MGHLNPGIFSKHGHFGQGQIQKLPGKLCRNIGPWTSNSAALSDACILHKTALSLLDTQPGLATTGCT